MLKMTINIRTVWAISVAATMMFAITAGAQQMTLARGSATVMVEPYADNIVRVSISTIKEDAVAPPGYGISAKPLPSGWTQESGARGDVLRSSRITVTVAPQGGKYTPTGTRADIAKFFGGSTPGVGVSITTADGAPLVQMRGWQMSVPNYKDGADTE